MEIVNQLPKLISRMVMYKNHTVKSKFRRTYQITHQKRRKFYVHLQSKVKIDLANGSK